SEWRWTEDLDAPVPSRRGTHPVEVDRSGRLETRRQRLARAAVEGLAGAWSLQGQQARRLRCDQKGVRNATRDHCQAASPELLLATVEVDGNCPFQHGKGLAASGRCRLW